MSVSATMAGEDSQDRISPFTNAYGGRSNMTVKPSSAASSRLASSTSTKKTTTQKPPRMHENGKAR